MTALPPRPNMPKTKEEELPDKTVLEQEGGVKNQGAFNTKLEKEQEGGRQLVERYARAAANRK